MALLAYPVLSEEAPTRVPIDDAGFAEIVDFYAYDTDLPLHAQVLSTQTHDGRELP